MSTLDPPEIVYVARVPTRRIMTVALGVGARLPAHATSMGRVLLAGLDDAGLDRFLEETTLERYTASTITDPRALRAAVLETRERGWAIVDQELEIGLRSVAAPVRTAAGGTVAAVNISAAALRVSLEEFRDRFLPALRETTTAISAAASRAAPGGRWLGVEGG